MQRRTLASHPIGDPIYGPALSRPHRTKAAYNLPSTNATSRPKLRKVENIDGLSADKSTPPQLAHNARVDSERIPQSEHCDASPDVFDKLSMVTGN